MGDHVDDPATAAKLAPSVTRPRPRLRLGFVVVLLLTMAAGIAALLVLRIPPATEARRANWWRDVGPHCTPLEVEVALREHNLDSSQRAICYAVAGKIDRARSLFAAMSDADRSTAVSTLFSIAHPIADAGDDTSAGPIMELVVELWPDNYMAVFHAGMAELALGQDDRAKVQLERFLTMYQTADVWRSRAEQGLAAIAGRVPLKDRQTHFAE